MEFANPVLRYVFLQDDVYTIQAMESDLTKGKIRGKTTMEGKEVDIPTTIIKTINWKP